MSEQAVAEFWSMFNSIASIDPTAPLSELDAALNQAINLMSSNLVECLSDQHSLHQAVAVLLHSPLFQNHSQRVTNIIVSMLIDPQAPLSLVLVGCLTLLLNGFQNSIFFRTLRTLKISALHHTSPVFQSSNPGLPDDPSQLIPVLLRIGARIGLVPPSLFSPTSSEPHSTRPGKSGVSTLVPADLPNETYAERKLGPVLSGLLYELCRVQRFEADILNLFSERLIDNLFELVELTRDQEDETFNYNLIKLIIALNEQFMIASLQLHPKNLENVSRHHRRKSHQRSDLDSNIIIRTMKHRLNESKTFGENLIFILNRASHSTPEGLCVSLLILKILYLLFTTPGTHEYFYTNDLCVLVDIFVRELSDLPDESDDLRHTYLRVLHPLLTQTQLRSYPYKREEIRDVLLSHLKYAHLQDINATTKRLVIRNLESEWCLELEKPHESLEKPDTTRLSCEPLRTLSAETLGSQWSGGGSISDVAMSNTGDISRSRTDSSLAPKVSKDDCPSSLPDHNRYTCSTSNSESATARLSHGSPILVQGHPQPQTFVRVIIADSSECSGSSPHAVSLSSPPIIHLPPSSSARSTSPISDIPHRPESSCSLSHSPVRRPAPKPPTSRRKEQVPLHLPPDADPLISNMPVTVTDMLGPKSMPQSTLSESAPAYRPGRHSCIPIPGPSSSHGVKLGPVEKIIRRAAPLPPLPSSPNFEEGKLPQRRKAPLPPGEKTRELRSTKSSGYLGFDHNHYTAVPAEPSRWKPGHGRVVSLSGDASCHDPIGEKEKNPFGE